MTVYATQFRSIVRQGSNERVPFDLTPALVHGDLEYLLPEGNVVLAPQQMIDQLKRKLKDFSDDDYILPLGCPVAAGAAIAVALQNNRQRAHLLKWDNLRKIYYKVHLDMNANAPKEGA